LQYVLEEGNRELWFDSKVITVLTAVAVISLITFIVHELETPHPIVDLRVFKDRDYTAGTVINFILGVSLFSGFFAFSLYCGTIMHYSAKDIGRIFLIAGTLQIVLMPLIGRFAPLFDGRKLVAIGVVGSTIALWMNGHLQADAGFWDLTKPQMVRTATMGLVFVPLSVLTLSRLPAMQRGNAAGLFNLTRELGGSIGTAAMGLLLDQRAALHTSRLVDHLDPYNPQMLQQLRMLSGLFVGRGIDPQAGALAVVQYRTNVQALVQSFNDGFVIAAGLFVMSLIFVFVIRKPVSSAPVAGAH
jgi:DHA2 family multidrug resistance protein